MGNVLFPTYTFHSLPVAVSTQGATEWISVSDPASYLPSAPLTPIADSPGWLLTPRAGRRGVSPSRSFMGVDPGENGNRTAHTQNQIETNRHEFCIGV
jgi:hypothetical protein